MKGASFDCQRCLLHADLPKRERLEPGWRPAGWEVHLFGPEKEAVWWCAGCVREVAAGSPEQL